MARRTETAFGQPEPARARAEMTLMGRNRELDLRAHVFVQSDQRQVAVRRRRGHQLERSVAGGAAKRARQVLAQRVGEIAESVRIVIAPHLLKPHEAALFAAPANKPLFLGDSRMSRQVVLEAALEARVGQLIEQHRRKAHRESGEDLGTAQARSHVEQRQISLDRGFVEPVLLHRIVPEPAGEMRMQDDYQAAEIIHPELSVGETIDAKLSMKVASALHRHEDQRCRVAHHFADNFGQRFAGRLEMPGQ